MYIFHIMIKSPYLSEKVLRMDLRIRMCLLALLKIQMLTSRAIKERLIFALINRKNGKGLSNSKMKGLK